MSDMVWLGLVALTCTFIYLCLLVAFDRGVWRRYVWNIVQALNRLLNAVLGGTDKEYMSSRICRYRDRHWLAGLMYRLLNSIETDHCEKALADCQQGFDPDDAVWK